MLFLDLFSNKGFAKVGPKIKVVTSMAAVQVSKLLKVFCLDQREEVVLTGSLLWLLVAIIDHVNWLKPSIFQIFL